MSDATISDIKLRALTPTAEGRAYRRSLEQEGFYVVAAPDPGPLPSAEEIEERVRGTMSVEEWTALWEQRRDAFEEHVRWAISVGLMTKPPKPKRVKKD